MDTGIAMDGPVDARVAVLSLSGKSLSEMGGNLMSFVIESRHLDDVIVIIPQAHRDERGFFMETYRSDHFVPMRPVQQFMASSTEIPCGEPADSTWSRKFDISSHHVVVLFSELLVQLGIKPHARQNPVHDTVSGHVVQKSLPLVARQEFEEP